MVMAAPHSRSLYISLVIIALFFFLYYYNFDAPNISFRKAGEAHKSPASELNGRTSLQDVLRYIYSPEIFSPTTTTFAHDGEIYKLPEYARYKSSLGKQICIVDVDTRPFENENQLFNEEGFDWPKLDMYSGGILNHYTYAKLHGYDYKFVNAANYTDGRHATWIKPSAISNALRDYKFVIFLDADASFQHMQIPIEWLLNYWGIGPKDSLSMAIDPPLPENNDKQGRPMTNTGFIIAQNNPKTFELLRAWDECPSEIRYKGCAEWKKPRFHEQSALGNYVRYDYEEYIKELPCDEANGESDYDKTESCRGVFVSHFWWRTSQVKSWFGDYTLQTLMGRLQGSVLDDKRHIVDRRENNNIWTS